MPAGSELVAGRNEGREVNLSGLELSIRSLNDIDFVVYEISSLGLPIYSYASASLCRKSSLVGRRHIARFGAVRRCRDGRRNGRLRSSTPELLFGAGAS